MTLCPVFRVKLSPPIPLVGQLTGMMSQRTIPESFRTRLGSFSLASSALQGSGLRVRFPPSQFEKTSPGLPTSQVRSPISFVTRGGRRGSRILCCTDNEGHAPSRPPHAPAEGIRPVCGGAKQPHGPNCKVLRHYRSERMGGRPRQQGRTER